MEKYWIRYYDIMNNLIDEIEVECKDEEEVKIKTDKYYEENLKNTDVAGANWGLIK